ncbi:hypothetical protein ACFFGH_07415 [Lysobacter korlensis]|uniref:Uncharacterized protein n=1 Tax=Lysobacter korlensis TaxID=553636 RepID=A0ABV6RL13_9GAMM
MASVTGCVDADLRVVDCSAELLRARVDVPLDAEALRVACPPFVTRRLALLWVDGLSSVSRGALVAAFERVPRAAGAPRFAFASPDAVTESWRRPGVPREACVPPAAVRLSAPLLPADLAAAPRPFAAVADEADLPARPLPFADDAPIAPAFPLVTADFPVLAAFAPLPAAAPSEAADFFEAVFRDAPSSSDLPAEPRAEVRFTADFESPLPAWAAGLERPPVFVAMGFSVSRVAPAGANAS